MKHVEPRTRVELRFGRYRVADAELDEEIELERTVGLQPDRDRRGARGDIEHVARRFERERPRAKIERDRSFASMLSAMRAWTHR
jgi:hypothetical protein